MNNNTPSVPVQMLDVQMRMVALRMARLQAKGGK